MNAELAHILYEILAVLGASMLVLVLSTKLRVPSVVGLILAGAAIGPTGLALVPDRHTVELFAEVGVVLLLFSIGLELSLERLARARRAFLFAGPLQALLTGAVAVGGALLLDLSVGQGVFLAFLFILSSTAVVLKIYKERREIATPHGELALGVLLFQDLLLVPMVVITPLLAGDSAADLSSLGARFGAALLATAAAFALARVLLPRILETLASTNAREAFLLGALFLGLGMAYLTAVLGLSPALGAFLAGVAAADSKFHYQLNADVSPFRDVFTSLFFVSIGMLVVPPASVLAAAITIALAFSIIAVKTLTGFGALRLAGFASGTSMVASLGLAQLGEFSFLLMAIGLRHDLLPSSLQDIVLAAAVWTLLLTPLAIRAAPALAERLPLATLDRDADKVPESNHVVIVGYSLSSQILARVLREDRLRYCLVDLSIEGVEAAQTDGHPVIYGDASRIEILDALSIESAKLLVVAVSDTRAQRQIIERARSINPNLRIVTVARKVEEIEEICDLGSDRVVAIEFESALAVLSEVLETFHVPRNIIRAQLRALRGGDYRILRAPADAAVDDIVLEALSEGATEVARIATGSPAAGKTLPELDLRRESGASVIAVVRDGQSLVNPGADLGLRVGDDLVLVGGHADLDRALALLRPSSPSSPSSQSRTHPDSTSSSAVS